MFVSCFLMTQEDASTNPNNGVMSFLLINSSSKRRLGQDQHDTYQVEQGQAKADTKFFRRI